MNNADVIKSLDEFKAADQATRDFFIFQAISGLNTRFAAKWVENVFITIGTLIGIGLLCWVGALIIKAQIFLQ